MNDFPWNVLLGLATCLCSDRVNENEPSEQGPMPDAGLSPDRPRGAKHSPEMSPIFAWVLGSLLGVWLVLLAAGPLHGADQETVGEVFGRAISKEEFAYHLKTAQLFSRSGIEKPTDEQTRQEAWQNMILLREADRLGLLVGGSELKAELKRLVREKGIEIESPSYPAWVSLTFHEDVRIFEHRIEELLKVNQLVRSKMDPQVTVTEEEIQKKFLDQYSSFECEYIRFDSEQRAKEFLRQVERNPRLWKETFDKRKADGGQKGAAWINTMSVEALVDLWKFPREDAFRILRGMEGDFLVAENIYGDIVLRLLSKKEASLSELDERRKATYQEAITAIKKRQEAKAYFDDLFKRANLRDYAREKAQAEEQAKRAAKIESLKEKSRVKLETNQGVIELRLFPEVAPKACENFIGLVEKGYYDGLLFHRVKKDFMIQGGDPTGTGTGGESLWGSAFEDEFKEDVVFDKPGLLAMANSGPNTNKSQFFITTVPTPWLNQKHTIFGEVISGMDVVRKIEGVPVDSSDRPKEEQKILRAALIKEGR